jgi:hypothetical protein
MALTNDVFPLSTCPNIPTLIFNIEDTTSFAIPSVVGVVVEDDGVGVTIVVTADVGRSFVDNGSDMNRNRLIKSMEWNKHTKERREYKYSFDDVDWFRFVVISSILQFFDIYESSR